MIDLSIIKEFTQALLGKQDPVDEAVNGVSKAVESFIKEQGLEFNPAKDIVPKHNPSSVYIKFLVAKNMRAAVAQEIDKYFQKLIAQDKATIPSVGKHERYSQGGEIIGYRILIDGVSLTAEAKPGGTGAKTATNIGDVAEGILGATLAARFLNREGGDITVEHVTHVLSILDEQNNISSSPRAIRKKIGFNVFDSDEKTQDKVVLDVHLTTGNFLDLMDPKKMQFAKDTFEAAIAYANSGRILDHLLDWYVDNKPSTVSIISDGVSEQTGTKVDVRVLVNGKEIDVGKISLKTSATEQLGQIGKKWEAMNNLFVLLFGTEILETRKKTWLKVTTNPMHRQPANIKKAAYNIYHDVYKQIQHKLVGDDDEEEFEFLRRLAYGIKYQAVLDEEGVQLVQLGRGTFNVLDFDKLEEALKGIDLDVHLRRSYQGNISPKLSVIDRLSGDVIISIRPKTAAGGKTVRHYVEKGKGLTKLIRVATKEEDE